MTNYVDLPCAMINIAGVHLLLTLRLTYKAAGYMFIAGMSIFQYLFY